MHGSVKKCQINYSIIPRLYIMKEFYYMHIITMECWKWAAIQLICMYKNIHSPWRQPIGAIHLNITGAMILFPIKETESSLRSSLI